MTCPEGAEPWEPQIYESLSSLWLKGAIPVTAKAIADQINCPPSIAAKIMRGHGWIRRRCGDGRGWWPPG